MNNKRKRRLALRVLQSATENSLLDSASLSDLVNQGVSLDMQDENGWTALHHASFFANIANVKSLLDNGADDTIKNGKDETAMHLAAGSEHGLLVLFTNKGANNTKDRSGSTVLHCAFRSTTVSADNVKLLLENGADATLKNNIGQTVLHLAATKSQDDLLPLILEKGVDLNTKDNRGLTALHMAVRCRNVNNIEYLLENGAETDVRNKNGETPFQFAASLAQEDVMTIFLDKGVSPDERDYQGNTALHHACHAGQTEIIEFLLERGVEADIKNNKGQTPLHLAAQSSITGPLIILTRKKLDLDTKDHQGWTALHYAVHSEVIANVKWLLVKDAYVDARCKNGNTPLHVAAGKKLSYSVALLQRGASLKIKNNLGYIPYPILRGICLDQVVWSSNDLIQTKQEFCWQLQKRIFFLPPVDVQMRIETMFEIIFENSKYNKLHQELQQIKITTVTEDFTLYEFISKNDLPKSWLNEDVLRKLENIVYSFDFYERFPEYGGIIRNKFKKSKRSRYFLTRQAIETVCNSKHYSYIASIDVWWHIFSFLRKDDLISFTRSGFETANN